MIGRVREADQGMGEPGGAAEGDGALPTAEAPAGTSIGGLGDRLKAFRRRAGLSLRELARQADVSPSLVSQIENGRSRPSVSTLYTFARLLDVTIDELFDAEEPGPVRSPVAPGRPDPAQAWRPSEFANRISVVHPSHRAHLRMAEGVDWERLAATPEQDVNFMKVTYAPGVASSEDGELQTHEGYEYGYVLAGTLEVTVGEEVFRLQAGESLGFDSTLPHRLHSVGDTDFQGIWFVHGRGHRTRAEQA